VDQRQTLPALFLLRWRLPGSATRQAAYKHTNISHAKYSKGGSWQIKEPLHSSSARAPFPNVCSRLLTCATANTGDINLQRPRQLSCLVTSSTPLCGQHKACGHKACGLSPQAPIYMSTITVQLELYSG